MKTINLPKEQLRIGNIVDYDGLFVEWHFGHWLGVDEGNYPFPSAHELSIEILEKLGFKEVPSKSGIQKSFKLNSIRVNVINSGNFYYRNTPLLGIHHLQNIYYWIEGKEIDTSDLTGYVDSRKKSPLPMQILKIMDAEIILKNTAENSGKIIIAHPWYNSSYHWGAMGGTIQEFIKGINCSYFADKLCSNTYTYDAKKTVRNVRKAISNIIPWYEYMKEQKELRIKIRELESASSENEFVYLMENFIDGLIITDVNWKDEEKFKNEIRPVFEIEPWNLIEQKTSQEYDFYCRIHSELCKKL